MAHRDAVDFGVEWAKSALKMAFTIIFEPGCQGRSSQFGSPLSILNVLGGQILHSATRLGV